MRGSVAAAASPSPHTPAFRVSCCTPEDFLLCSLLLFTEGKMQAWGLEGLGGTCFLLFLSGLLACTQQLLIVGYKDSWLQSNIADFEHHRCFAKQGVVKMNYAIELSREKAISYVSKGAFLQCFWYGIQDRRHLLAWLLWYEKRLSCDVDDLSRPACLLLRNLFLIRFL